MKTFKTGKHFIFNIFESLNKSYNRTPYPHSSLDMTLRSARSFTLKMRVLIRLMASLVQVFIA